MNALAAAMTRYFRTAEPYTAEGILRDALGNGVDSYAARYLRSDGLENAMERLQDEYASDVHELLEELAGQIKAGHFLDLGDSYTTDPGGNEVHPGINLLEWYLQEAKKFSPERARAIVAASKYAGELECEQDTRAAAYCLARDVRDEWRRRRLPIANRGALVGGARTGCRSRTPESNVVQLFPADGPEALHE